MTKVTKKDWEESNLDFTDFLKFPCEVDEKLFMYFLEIGMPRFHQPYQEKKMDTFQSIEAQYRYHDINGKTYYYMTFSEIDGRYFYLGILPDMHAENDW